MASLFSHLKPSRNFLAVVASLAKESELDHSLVSNVFQFCQCLCVNNVPAISDLVFKSQMVRHFDITNKLILSCMFGAFKSIKSQHMTPAELAKVICTFLSSNYMLKVDFVFRCYDMNGDNNIDFFELYSFLKSSFIEENDAESEEEATRDLIEIVRSIFDENSNGEIDRSEFRSLVKTNSLFLELLGKVLPNDDVIERFRSKLQGKTLNQVKMMFADERCKALSEPVFRRETRYYPIKLYLP